MGIKSQKVELERKIEVLQKQLSVIEGKIKPKPKAKPKAKKTEEGK